MEVFRLDHLIRKGYWPVGQLHSDVDQEYLPEDVHYDNQTQSTQASWQNQKMVHQECLVGFLMLNLRHL